MDKTLLVQPRLRLRIWIALLASLSLHAAAVAIAQMDREPIPTAGGSTLADPFIEIVESSSPNLSSPEIEPTQTTPPLPPDDQLTPEVPAKLTLTARQMPRVTHSPSRLTRDHSNGLTNSVSAQVLALSAPRPEYPYEARRSRLTGSGVAIFAIDSTSGAVIGVIMEKSTGSSLLDQSTLAGLRRWRFKPGTPPTVRCPVTFTLTGAAF